MTTWRDQPVPGSTTLPTGVPLTQRTGTPAPAPSGALHGYLAAVSRHENIAAPLSARARWGLILITVADLACAVLLYQYIRPWNPELAGPILSWGGRWELVAAIAATAGLCLIGLAVPTRVFGRATSAQMWAIWGALAASAPTTGLALIIGALAATIFAILAALLGFILFGLLTAALE